MKRFAKRFSLLTLLASALLLSACSSTPSPTAATTRAGIVGGSGTQLTLNGQPLNISKASFSQDDDTATASVLQPGVELEAKGRSNGSEFEAEHVSVKTRVKGQIDVVTSSDTSLEVVGVKVSADASTRFVQRNADGSFTDITFTDLAPGDYLEVYGLPQKDDSILATRIMRKTEDNINKVELRLKIRNVDMTAKTFTYGLGTHTVNFSSAEVRGTLADGAMVRFKGVRNGVTITAEKVRLGNDDGRGGGNSGGNSNDDDGNIELKGLIAGLDSSAKTFSIYDFKVDYSSATVDGTLADGVWVEVHGSVGSDSVIKASRVHLEDRGSDDNSGDDNGGSSNLPQAKGTVDSVDTSALTLSVSGTSFWANSSTKVERNGVHVSFSAVSAGQFVEVRFDSSRANTAGAAYAAKIEINSQDGSGGTGGEQELTGTVSSFDAATKTFMMGSTKVSVQNSTEYKNAANNNISSSEFWGTERTGSSIKVEGTRQDGVLVAREVKLR
jgi:Domain of unknown function (DUF5666)